jgi:hypothetical protein
MIMLDISFLDRKIYLYVPQDLALMHEGPTVIGRGYTKWAT